MKADMMGGAYDMYICGRTGVHTSFWLENMKKETTCKNVGLDWKIIGVLVLKEQEEMIWAVCFKTQRMAALVNTGSQNVGNFLLCHTKLFIYLFSPSISHFIHSCVLFKATDLVSKK
jgi:hypothetical protein